MIFPFHDRLLLSQDGLQSQTSDVPSLLVQIPMGHWVCVLQTSNYDRARACEKSYYSITACIGNCWFNAMTFKSINFRDRKRAGAEKRRGFINAFTLDVDFGIHGSELNSFLGVFLCLILIDHILDGG